MVKRILITLILISIAWPSFPDAIGKNGIVTSSNKYASEAGIQVLKNGGNAIDAAVAVGFALAVVHPGAGNIGGGGFMVIRLADGDVKTIDFRETAPSAAYRDMFLDDSLNVIPGKSWSTSWASGVPGSVAGLGVAHEKFGSLPWWQLLNPAINLAQQGYELDFINQSNLNNPYYIDYLSNDSESKKIFTKDNGFFELGEVFVQKDLAKTLKRISRRGYKEFYNGRTAEMIVKCMDRTNGLITMEDLRQYEPVLRDAISFDYRGYTIHSMPPASSGGIALALILNQLENIDFSNIPYHSLEHIHYVVEAERRAYADRAHFLGDMDYVPVPIERMVSQEYADSRFAEINPKKASRSDDVNHGDIKFEYNEKEETTHYSVVDKWGNAVSVTTTVNGWYGNGIVVDGAGFLLNNEMDDFSSKPGVPNKYGLIGTSANAIEPNKRMLSSMTPTIVEDNEGDLFLVLGSPGGSTIITTVAQIIINMIDYKMHIEDAVESPRFHHQWLPDMIQVEKMKFSKEVLDALEDAGHSYSVRHSIGEANCIQITNGGTLRFGSGDSRRGASAIAY